MRRCVGGVGPRVRCARCGLCECIVAICIPVCGVMLFQFAARLCRYALPYMVLCISEQSARVSICIAVYGPMHIRTIRARADVHSRVYWSYAYPNAAAENPALPDALARAARPIVFVGPPARPMRALGDKIGSTIIAQSAGACGCGGGEGGRGEG